MELSPYLFFSGTCEEALKFYEENIGAKIEAVMKHAGSPMEEHVPAEWRDKVMHAKFKVGDVTVMAADTPPDHYAKPQGFALSLSSKDAAEGEAVFNKLAAGGSVQMPFGPTFWAKGFGMCTDRYGIGWMINCE
jgi:PhnB protein